MIKIKELEEYFGKSFDEILADKDIVCIAENDYIKLGGNGYIKTTIDFAWEDYVKWEKENYFRTMVRFKKEDEERIRQAAGDSLNGFIVSAVLEKIEKQNS